LLISLLLPIFYKGIAQNIAALPISITIKVDSEYEKIYAKSEYANSVWDNDYSIDTDSVKQKNFIVSVQIKNTGAKPVGIWLMTCSWQHNFTVNNNYLHLQQEQVCLHNRIQQVKLLHGETHTYKAVLVKSIKFDYPCQNCIYGPQVEATRLGLIVVNDVFKNQLNMLTWHIAMEDKSLWQVVWSNPLYLLGKGQDRAKLNIIN